MIKVIRKQELKTKILLEKDGIPYEIVIAHRYRIDAIYKFINKKDEIGWKLLETKSIKKVFGVEKSVLLTQLGFIKSESIVINPSYGEV